jgi:hypothetical protein
MARKPKKKAAPTGVGGIDESALTKGEIRKLKALRKSVGDTLGEATFAKWLEKRQSSSATEPTDKNAEMIAERIMGLIESKGIRLPRGGYLITRGRGRVIVEAAKS